MWTIRTIRRGPPDSALLPLTDAWWAIFGLSISDIKKNEACVSALRGYVKSIASHRVGQENAPLRFYADMLILREGIDVALGWDHRGQLALMPAHDWIREWFAVHTQIAARWLN